METGLEEAGRVGGEARCAGRVGRALRVVPPSRAGVARSAPASHRELVFPDGYVPGVSPAMQRLEAQLQRVAACDAPVLVLGETGVGKELVAQTLHASSPRAEGPFVAVNCAAVPHELMEAEMFGVERGAASGVVSRPGHFRRADGGTLFLDEVGDLSPPLQAKLLRALQGSGIQPVGGAPLQVDARIITATNSDVASRVERGGFRRDLYYRIAGLVVRVPPLRERPEDVPVLARAFLAAAAQRARREPPRISEKALRLLAARDWPGNVRELQHEMTRLLCDCGDGEVIDADRLPEQVRDEPASSLRIDVHIAELERGLIRAALARTGGRRAPAARLLGISRNGLALKLARLGSPSAVCGTRLAAGGGFPGGLLDDEP